MSSKAFIALVVASLGFALTGCVTHIKTDVYQNPAPAEKFVNFNRIELSRIRLLPPYAGQEANEEALRKIQENVDLKMNPVLATWNAAPTPASGGARTLFIDLTIPEIKFISGGNRFWGGALAGSSAVKLRAQLAEKETGKVVATAEFYAKGAAMSGALTFGGTDNAMLVRLAERLSSYLLSNYSEAVGGPTGAEPSS